METVPKVPIKISICDACAVRKNGGKEGQRCGAFSITQEEKYNKSCQNPVDEPYELPQTERGVCVRGTGGSARGDWETDEARARTWGAPCYGGTEHVADKRAPLFKERGAAVKCAPIRHHRLILSLNEPGEGSLGVRRIRRCLAPITLPGLFYSNLTHKLSHSQSGRRCLSHSGRMLTRQMNE